MLQHERFKVGSSHPQPLPEAQPETQSGLAGIVVDRPFHTGLWGYKQSETNEQRLSAMLFSPFLLNDLGKPREGSFIQCSVAGCIETGSSHEDWTGSAAKAAQGHLARGTLRRVSI